MLKNVIRFINACEIHSQNNFPCIFPASSCYAFRKVVFVYVVEFSLLTKLWNWMEEGYERGGALAPTETRPTAPAWKM